MIVKIRPGGLMRCCLSTIDEAAKASTTLPKEGATLHCIYHDGYGMIYRNGAWEWNKPNE